MIQFCKDNINSKRLFDERWHYLNKVNINLDPEWVRGFVDGEGSFQINIGNYNNRGRPLLRVAATFEIAQNSHEIKLLEAPSAKFFFGRRSGYLKPKYNIESLEDAKRVRSVSRYVSNDNRVVIEFFDKYPLKTIKNLDFLDWKKIIKLKSEDGHKKGKLDLMISIKNTMNRNRFK